MKAYLAKRLAIAVFVLFGVSIVIFLVARVIPGDPARVALGPLATSEQVALLRQRLHLDDPLPVQYWHFLTGVLQGDFGRSLYTQRAVTTDLAQFAPATIELVLASALLMMLVGIPLGVAAAHYRDRPMDHGARIVALLGIVTPNFVWAIILVLIFSYALGIMPVIGRLPAGVIPPPHVTGLYTVDALIAGDLAKFGQAVKHLTLPAIALALSGIGQAARLTRSNMLQSYGQDYIKLARAYGFSERSVALKYALRPALIPTLTILGLDFASKLGNAFLIEAVFSWPGMARYGVSAILNKDLNAIVGTVMVIAVAFVLINLVIDVLVTYLDPRIRARGVA